MTKLMDETVRASPRSPEDFNHYITELFVLNEPMGQYYVEWIDSGRMDNAYP